MTERMIYYMHLHVTNITS